MIVPRLITATRFRGRIADGIRQPSPQTGAQEWQ
jgi:hypothetical protein